MKISINEPCHEDWQNMTPNQQGAFCGSCMKDVVDFSNKSIGEIKSFFATKTTEKICGRFEKKQLEYFSFDDFFSSFRYWNFAKKFAVIFFFTFGLTGFSTSYAQNTQHLLGEPAVQKPSTLKGDVAYPGDVNPTKKDSTKKQPKIMGKVKCVEPPKQNLPKKQEPAVMGMIAMPPKQEKKSKN